MHVTEFKTIVKDSYIEIPDFEYFKNKEVKIIIFDLKKEQDGISSKKVFNPKDFFGVGNASKEEIETYLIKSKGEWDNYV